MRKLDPPLTETQIRREQFALEEAIRNLEAEKLSRLAQSDDRLTGKLNELVQKMEQVRQQMAPKRRAS
jgi:prefoldin subunit 5